MLSGVLCAQKAALLTGKDGLTLDEARAQADHTGSLEAIALPKGYYSNFVELHIEQGPLLEQSGTSLGIVTHIAAPASLRATVLGEGGHAGGRLMPGRKDALAAASELVLAVEEAALGTGAIDSVATVGVCEVFPGAVNSIPSRVKLEMDLRDTDKARRDGMLKHVRKCAEKIEEKRGVSISLETINADDPATCDLTVQELYEQSARAHGWSTMRMVSRAYHDSLFMAQVAPIAMLFIPCKGGVSHRPDEYSSPEEMERGVQVLAETMAALAGS
jgi:N-carbamoyl-L-amino-acid hydrolase